MTQSAYDSSLAYITGQQVIVGAVVYQAVQTVPPATSPPNGTYWEVVPVTQAYPAGVGYHFSQSFTFADDTELAAGVPILTLNDGDLIAALWCQVDTAFNGTTPKGDVGTFSTAAHGLFDEIGSAVLDMTTADTVPTDNTGLQLPTAAKCLEITKGPLLVTVNGAVLYFVVSEDGSKGGTATGATAGACTIHAVIIPAQVIQ